MTVTESCQRAPMELDGILRSTAYAAAHRTVTCSCGSVADVVWEDVTDTDHSEPQWMATGFRCRSAACRQGDG